MYDYEYFNTYFYYFDGDLYWKRTVGTRGIKGNRAGKLRKDGYYDVGLQRKLYLVHRIIYCLHHKTLPEVVDHINRNPSDNRIENLRSANFSLNAWNSGISKNNTSGVKGIRKTSNGKYEARVAKNGETFHVGTFNSLEEASKALQEIREKVHDCFTCHG